MSDAAIQAHPHGRLPEGPGLNVAALAGLFRHTTNSYKFVFFLALLDLLERHRFDATRPYGYDEIVVEMLSIAWFAHTYFKLSFGTQDTIARKLDALDLKLSDADSLAANDRRRLRAALAASDLREARRLMDFVPYRLLIPFLEAQVRHVDKASWMVFESTMPALTNAHFAHARPLYRFDSDDYRRCSAILWHRDWAAYLESHLPVIRAWAAWHWLQYMQRRNPATPAIASKLFPPARRESLARQTRHWRSVLAAPGGPPLRCIYSGEVLTAEGFALDHYLPWSFVMHDQLWNLIPAPPPVNCAKSNRLPDDSYFRAFVDLQHSGLIVAHQALSKRQFEQVAEDYMTDLHLPSPAALLERERLGEAYARTVGPLLALATNQGFSPNWQHAS